MKVVAAFNKKHYNRTSDCLFWWKEKGFHEEKKKKGMVRKMRGKKLAALLMGGIMAVSVLAGCGSVDKNAVVATLDGKEISLGVANFAARLQQASYDDFYVSYFGAEVWSSDMYGNGTTMESSMKESIIENVRSMYTLQAHMEDYGVTLSDDEKGAIAQAASDFIASNEDDAIKALGAEQAIVEEYLTLVTIQSKMYDAIIVDTDTNVSDEEANTSSYSYVRKSKSTYTDADGNSVEHTEESLKELADTMAAFVEDAREGNMEDAAEKEEYNYYVYSGTFTADNDSLDEAVLTTLKGLDEGEISDVIDTDSNYYVVRLDAVTDEEATEATRQSIISQRQSELYQEVLSGWQEDQEWVVDEKVWATVTFDNLFTTIVESTETEEVTEAVTEE